MKLILPLSILFFISNSFANEFSIIKYQGEVLVNGEKLNINFPLQIGDSLESRGENSYIIFKNKNLSTFLIRDGKLKIQKSDNNKFMIQLSQGKLFHFLNPNKSKKSFIIRTSNAVFSTTGLKYLIEAKNTHDYLIVLEGSVLGKKLSSANEFLTTSRQDLFIYYGPKPPHKQTASKLMYNRAKAIFKFMGHPVKKYQEN